MAGSTQDDDEGMISGINVTPLVDITLVLLIIFMVTASYIVRASIEVDLPRAANGGETVGQMLTVVLKQKDDASGAKIKGAPCDQLYVNGQFTDEAGLRASIKEALDKDKEAKAIISADQDCSHGEVVHIIDFSKGEGISKFAINIEKTEAAGAAAAPASAP
jgi:biopolymer transport protein ExbD